MIKRILILFLVVITIILSIPFNAFAETITLKDLNISSISSDLSNIDLSQYIQDDTLKNPYIVTLAEQGFTSKTDYANCKLFVYLYYPKSDEISFTGKNYIQIKYGSNYVKYRLIPISTENDTLIKFRVDLPAEFFKKLNDRSRVYEISSVELQTKSGIITDYEIGGKYTFEGYDDKTTLKSVETFEVVQLDINYTTFRNSSELGTLYKNQLTSVYFSIPQYLLDRYNNELYGIDCTYEKYYTRPILVTKSEDIYNELKKFTPNSLVTYINRDINIDGFKYSYNPDFPLSIYSIDKEVNNSNFELHTYSFAFNKNLSDTAFRNYFVTDNYTLTPYIPLYFYTDNDFDSNFWISKEVVLNQLNEVYKTLDQSNKYLKIDGLDYFHRHLYENYILNSSGEKLTVSAENSKFNGSITFDKEPYNMISYSDSHSAWERFLAFGFKGLFVGIKNDVSYKDIAPIMEIKSSDIYLDNENFSTTYFVDKNEVSEVKEVVSTSALKGDKTFIFRVDVSPYIAFPVKSSIGLQEIDTESFICQEPVYMGFDVLDLMFKDENSEIIKVSVVADPQDLVGGLEPDVNHQVEEDFDNWKDELKNRFNEFAAKIKKIIILLFAFVFFALFIAIIPYIIRFISSLIDGISRMLQGTSNSIKRKRNKRNKK